MVSPHFKPLQQCQPDVSSLHSLSFDRAFLHRNGQVEFHFEQQWNPAPKLKGVLQIQLTSSGLWCRTSRGKVYRLDFSKDQPEKATWVREGKLPKIKELFQFPGDHLGRLGVITKRNATLVQSLSGAEFQNENFFDNLKHATALYVIHFPPGTCFSESQLRTLANKEVYLGGELVSPRGGAVPNKPLDSAGNTTRKGD